MERDVKDSTLYVDTITSENVSERLDQISAERISSINQDLSKALTQLNSVKGMDLLEGFSSSGVDISSACEAISSKISTISNKLKSRTESAKQYSSVQSMDKAFGSLSTLGKDILSLGKIQADYLAELVKFGGDYYKTLYEFAKLPVEAAKGVATDALGLLNEAGRGYAKFQEKLMDVYETVGDGVVVAHSWCLEKALRIFSPSLADKLKDATDSFVEKDLSKDVARSLYGDYESENYSVLDPHSLTGASIATGVTLMVPGISLLLQKSYKDYKGQKSEEVLKANVVEKSDDATGTDYSKPYSVEIRQGVIIEPKTFTYKDESGQEHTVTLPANGDPGIVYKVEPKTFTYKDESGQEHTVTLPANGDPGIVYKVEPKPFPGSIPGETGTMSPENPFHNQSQIVQRPAYLFRDQGQEVRDPAYPFRDQSQIYNLDDSVGIDSNSLMNLPDREVERVNTSAGAITSTMTSRTGSGDLGAQGDRVFLNPIEAAEPEQELEFKSGDDIIIE